MLIWELSAALEVINLGSSRCLLPVARTAFSSEPETEEPLTICCYLYLLFSICIFCVWYLYPCVCFLMRLCVCVLILMCLLWLYLFARCTASCCEYTPQQKKPPSQRAQIPMTQNCTHTHTQAYTCMQTHLNRHWEPCQSAHAAVIC